VLTRVARLHVETCNPDKASSYLSFSLGLWQAKYWHINNNNNNNNNNIKQKPGQCNPVYWV